MYSLLPFELLNGGLCIALNLHTLARWPFFVAIGLRLFESTVLGFVSLTPTTITGLSPSINC